MNYAYDEELPYVVARIKKDEVGSFRPGIIARFRTYEDAFEMAENFQPGWVEMADTTPKPKIPEGAKYLTWVNDGETYLAVKLDGYWVHNGMEWSDEDFLTEAVGDADVTVLTPATDTP